MLSIGTVGFVSSLATNHKHNDEPFTTTTTTTQILTNKRATAISRQLLKNVTVTGRKIESDGSKVPQFPVRRETINLGALSRCKA